MGKCEGTMTKEEFKKEYERICAKYSELGSCFMEEYIFEISTLTEKYLEIGQ